MVIYKRKIFAYIKRLVNVAKYRAIVKNMLDCEGYCFAESKDSRFTKTNEKMALSESDMSK